MKVAVFRDIDEKLNEQLKFCLPNDSDIKRRNFLGYKELADLKEEKPPVAKERSKTAQYLFPKINKATQGELDFVKKFGKMCYADDLFVYYRYCGQIFVDEKPKKLVTKEAILDNCWTDCYGHYTKFRTPDNAKNVRCLFDVEEE